MAREPDTRVQLYSTGGMTLALAAAGYAWQRGTGLTAAPR